MNDKELETVFYKILDKDNNVLSVGYYSGNYWYIPFEQFKKLHPDAGAHYIERIEVFKYTYKDEVLARRHYHITHIKPNNNCKLNNFMTKLHQLRESSTGIPDNKLSPHIKQALSILANSTSSPAPKDTA